MLSVLLWFSSSDNYSFVLFYFHPVAAQEKPNCQKVKLCSKENEPLADLPNQVTEDSNGLESSSNDGTDGNFPEEASKVDLIDNEPVGAVLGSDLPVASEEHNLAVAQATGDRESDLKKGGGKRKLQIQGKWKGVDPVLFFKDEAIISSIRTFYGIDESFPLSGHLVSRNLDNNHVKRIYYVSKSVKDVLELNFSVGQQLKIASIGMKMFVSISIQ